MTMLVLLVTWLVADGAFGSRIFKREMDDPDYDPNWDPNWPWIITKRAKCDKWFDKNADCAKDPECPIYDTTGKKWNNHCYLEKIACGMRDKGQSPEPHVDMTRIPDCYKDNVVPTKPQITNTDWVKMEELASLCKFNPITCFGRRSAAKIRQLLEGKKNRG